MIYNLNQIESKEIIPGFKGKFVHGAEMTIASWTVEKGACLPEHSHVHEQITKVVKGTFEMILDSKKVVLQEGMVVSIPSNTKHSGIALTDCIITDVFSPARPEYNNDL